MIKLSPKEKEYCQYLLMALTQVEIAERMGIAERTVKGYAWHVGTKLNVDDTRHLNVQIATKIHDIRAELGIKCQACGEM